MSLLTVRMFGIGAAQSIATLTLLRGIDGLLSNPTLYEDGEEQPTERAISRAKALISEASEAARSSGRPVLASARVVPFNGSIRITWATEAKNLRLVVMASEAQPDYLYREQVTDGRAYGQHLHRPVSPQLLAESLDWLTA